jgi:hypothetical protein
MENTKVTKSWGVAAAIIAAVICIAAAAFSVWTVAQTKPANPCMPPVSIQWMPQTILETRFAAKIVEDNKFLKAKLDELAQLKSKKDFDGWEDGFASTYLLDPSFWTGKEWVKGWARVKPLLKEIVDGSQGVSIDAVSGIIEYKPRFREEPAETDIDAVITIRVTFSASPGGNILEGTLKHSRVCEII